MATFEEQVLASFDSLTTIMNAILGRLPAGGGTPITPTPPPGPSPSELIAAFIAKYTPLDPAAFQALYGVAFKAKLPALARPFTADSLVAYARIGYDTNGNYVGGPMIKQGSGETSPEDVAAQAVSDNAHGLATYYTGNGRCDADVCAIGFKMGFFHSKGVMLSSLGAGSPNEPLVYAGVPLQTLIDHLNEVGGTPGTLFA
jgi:hypothetical protein